MREFFQRLAARAAGDGARVAVSDDAARVSYADLASRVAGLAARLPRDARTVALGGRPGIDWIVADLAVTLAGRRLVPIPAFFGERQVQHLLRDAAVDLVLCCGVPGTGTGAIPSQVVSGTPGAVGAALPAYAGGAERVIYTSGTTGTPKGVLHGDRQIGHAVRAIGAAVGACTDDVHLSALPPALLLEQIAGVLVPLAAGARVHVPAQAIEAALLGDPAALPGALAAARPTTTVLVPQLLSTLVAAARGGAWRAPASLRFAAVGGAPVPLALVRDARALGIPVIRGYGLSECASVVSLERPDAPCDGPDGYCGTPLDGLQVTIEDGEVVVRGPTVMEGYLGGTSPAGGTRRTGDSGTLIAGGGLCVHGRRDRILVLPSGRNVSADWVEATLLADPRLAAARVTLAPDGALQAHVTPRDGIDGAHRAPGIHRVPGPGGAAGARAAVDVNGAAGARDATTARGAADARGANGAPAPATPRSPASAAALVRDACEALRSLPAYARPDRVLLAPAAAAPPAPVDAAPRVAAVPARPLSTGPSSEANPMSVTPFFQRLQAETRAARDDFLSVPVIAAALRGEIDRGTYLRYLGEAYHHVRHTCPLLGAALARCGDRDERYREALLDYLDEERGHERWILEDIEALGGDADAVRAHGGGDAVRVMVAYVYDAVTRGSPYAMLGMVHVLEGMSVLLARPAADAIQRALGGGAGRGFSYLRSHGTLDREHVAFFERLVNDIEDPAAQQAIVDTARIVYRLFAEVFREVGVEPREARDAA